MKKSRVVERYCEIIKEEPLSTLEADLTADNTCVMESTSPFFGYYQDAPMGKPDPYIYCLLDRYYSLSEIMRAAENVNAHRREPVDITPGQLYLMDRRCPVIRLKDIRHFNQVHILQQSLQQEGIVFKKRQRKIKEVNGIIRLSKMIRFQSAGDGLFMDAIDDTKGYFVIPRYLGWEAFKKLTKEAKYDTCILYFDAAQASFFENGRVVELVRVYKEHITSDDLLAIKNRYIQVLK
ncbi:MAG: hypothetical protein EA394_02655 [Bacteroidia bacterium]|nr:MAG: hypothetical protein EA394_02655 [Bacteroidia bacterium]